MAADNVSSVSQMKNLQFKDKLAALNRDFLKVLRTWYEQCPHYDFSDTVQSYLKHVEALDAQYFGAVKENQKQQQEEAKKEKVKVKEPVTDENAVGGRKIAKAKRRLPADPDKLNESVVVSTPARNPPRFSLGNVSAIEPASDTPPAAVNEPSAGAGGRKRAIRGGGPLGDKEQVVFRGSDAAKPAASSIPPVSLNLPKPTTGFWNSQKESAGVDEKETFAKWAEKKKDDEKVDEKPEEKKEAPKPIFSFGKTSGDSNGAEKKADDKPKGFGGFTGFDFSAAQKDSKEKEAEPAKPAFSFGGFNKKEASDADSKEKDAPKPAFVFGSLGKKEESDAPKPALSFPTFGAKTDSAPAFGAKKDDGSTMKPTLSFPSFGATPVADGSKPGLSFPSFGGAAPTLTFGAPKTEEEKKDDEEGEYVPPKAEVVEAEEPGSTFSSKCAVFKMVDKQFTKMGVGMLHLKDVDDKKSILVRAATTTGNVWINAVINNMMKVVKADEKGDRLRLTYPISAGEMGIFLIRFGNVATAEKVLNHINDNNQ